MTTAWKRNRGYRWECLGCGEELGRWTEREYQQWCRDERPMIECRKPGCGDTVISPLPWQRELFR